MENDEKELEPKNEEGQDEGGEDDTKGGDETELTPEQIRGIKQRKFTKLAKELGIDLKPKSAEKEVETKGFDLAAKSYLKASGVSSEDFSLVEEIMKATGKGVEDVLETKYFQAELKERKESRETKRAIPESKRSTASSRTEVDYWINKGELPPVDQVELRRAVVNAKIKKESGPYNFR